MALIRDINLLEPKTKESCFSALKELESLGIPYYVNETLRKRSVQGCYWLQGRVDLEVVNLFRAEAGLWPLTADENKNQITKTIKSKHIEGKAIDIAPMKSGSPWWGAPISEYQKIAEVMKRHGFEWGGDWKDFQDSPHYQIKE